MTEAPAVRDKKTSPEVVLSYLETLPTLPAVALRVLAVTAERDSGARDVVELVRNDQSLTAKLLSVANSAASGVSQPVQTLEQAIPLIGFAAVRSTVLATSVFGCFPESAEDGDGGAFDRREFWKHALGVACAAKRLAQVRRDLDVDAEDAFVAGLLHDLGKVAFDAVFPKAYDRVATHANQTRGDIADSERSILGADHNIAGRRLAERWHLPTMLQEVIWLHHLSTETLPASVSCPALIRLVQLADTIVREQRIGYSGNHVFYESSAVIADRLGFDSDQITDVTTSLAHDVATQAALLGLEGETAEALYVKAMTRANSELGRLNAELLTRNRRLAAGARYFRAIGDFERQLTDWADPTAVVVALCQAAASALQQPRVVVFGLRQNNAAIDLCWTGPSEQDHGHSTQSVPNDLTLWLEETQQQMDALAMPVPRPIHTLLDPILGPAGRGMVWLLPILHERRLAGGIVYSSDADERSRLAEESEELRSFLTGLGLALGRANAQTAARRLSEDLADTNRRLQQTQKELLRTRTLSMIAEMAAGAAHELNGPLTVISGRAQILEGAIKDADGSRALQTIVGKAHECSRIVTELMDFARPRSPSPQRVDLAELFETLRAEWLQETGRPASTIAVDVVASSAPEHSADGALYVHADPDQLRLVVRELLANAVAALDSDTGAVKLHAVPAEQGSSVRITVSDNGCGMEPAVRDRAFDPFFSHRDAGRSRGLGLARVHRVVEAHNGRIWLDSRVGEGTAAHVVLPRG